jgi:hypothetical protein
LYEILDSLRESIQLCRNQEILQEAISWYELGRIHLQVLKNETLARRCLNQAV